MRKNLSELKRERDEALEALEKTIKYWEEYDNDNQDDPSYDPEMIKEEINSAELRYYEAEEAIEEYRRDIEIDSYKDKGEIEIREKIEDLLSQLDEGNWNTSKEETLYNSISRLEQMVESK